MNVTDQPVVQVDNLQKVYRDGFIRRKRIEALRGVSFQIGNGEIFGLLGPNGAGKTTLIKILLGIVKKSGGEAQMLGQPVGDRGGRKKVGYLPEHHRIPRHLNGNTTLEYYGQLSGLSMSEVKKRRPALLDMVGLGDWGKTSVKKYSKGMQQRLGLAQAMLHDPDLLILDEPTDGVDPVGRTEIRSVLNRLKGEGKTIFLNSHLLQELELVCDRVAILNHGRLMHVGSVEEMTQLSNTLVEVTLVGEMSAAKPCLCEFENTRWSTLDDGRLRVSLPISEQSDVDKVIDSLRAAGLSIFEVSRNRLTLEQAFLQLVKTPKDELAEPTFID
ncbi:MAG: ABC transporter ATP-binding protein [Planctomycetaceae bacterium]|nr:ABC transporter ATP-binding protein [Planctomycetaceae bacterium]